MDHLVHERLYRSNETIKRVSSASICICGCGAIGANLADSLSRMGVRHIRLIDFDRVEQHNIGTQPWLNEDIGMKKVVALFNIIYRATRFSPVTSDNKLDAGNQSKLIGKPDLIIDAFDNSDSRGCVVAYADRTHIPCLHIGLAADYAEIIWNERYKVPQASGADDCNYPLARTTIMLAVAVATEVVIRFIDKKIMRNYTITLNDFAIKELI